MRLKKLPIAVNISVEVKDVSSPHSPNRKKGLGCVSSSVAPGGKKYTCRKADMQVDPNRSQNGGQTATLCTAPAGPRVGVC